VRGVTIGVWHFAPLLDIAVLLAFALLAVAAGALSFRRMQG
jgi:hypothetical protein